MVMTNLKLKQSLIILKINGDDKFINCFRTISHCLCTHRFISPEYPSALGPGDSDRSRGHVGIDDWFSHQEVDVIVKISMDVLLQ